MNAQVAVVVGAASGIGKATAEHFRRKGISVAWLDVSPAITEVVAEFETAHAHLEGRSLPLVVDATDGEVLRAAAEEVHALWGRVDHLVISIGLCSGTLGFPFWNLAPNEWHRVLEVNLIGPVNVVHTFAAALRTQSSGTICLVASVAGQIGSQTDPPYSAAKAGLINFTQCAAKDLAPYGIRVNAVAPGMVKTPMNQQVWQAWRDSCATHTLSYDQWAEEKIKSTAPLGRWQTCDDVAEAILFLASDGAKNITGQTINVDGGQVMHS